MRSALEPKARFPMPTSLRLDRLLSTELHLSRGYISKLARDERLRVAPERGHELRRSIADGTKITIILRGDARPSRSPPRSGPADSWGSSRSSPFGRRCRKPVALGFFVSLCPGLRLRTGQHGARALPSAVVACFFCLGSCSSSPARSRRRPLRAGSSHPRPASSSPPARYSAAALRPSSPAPWHSISASSAP